MMPYNGKFNEYSQLYQELGQVTVMDLIKSFNDKKDTEERLKADIQELKTTVSSLMRLLGHHDRYSVERAAIENIGFGDKKILLKMDMSGNIWLNGILENNPNKIGKEIVKIAQEYRDNLPIASLSNYLNEERVEINDTPF